MSHLVVETIRKAGWAPIVVLASHGVASQVFDAYASWPWIDVPMHLAGGMAIAYVAYVGVKVLQCRDVVGSLSAWAKVLVMLLATALAAVLWEGAEWASDRCFGTHSLGDATDTTKDVLLGILGGLVVVCIVQISEAVREMGGRSSC